MLIFYYISLNKVVIKNLMILTRTLIKTSLQRSLLIKNFCSDDDFKRKPKVQITNENAQELIKKWVNDYDVVLFMKGTPQMPRCGYSASVV